MERFPIEVPKPEQKEAPPLRLEVVRPEDLGELRRDLLQLDKAFEGKTGNAAKWAYIQLDPERVLVVLREESGKEKVVAYTYAHTDRGEENDRSAHVASTVIDPAYRGRGLADRLMDALEGELRTKGYEYMTRDTSNATGYADRLLARYGDRVISARDFTAGLGPMKEMKVKL
jgi:ribosomal protein S18 acetylase RimI-like enzyme